jgi:hypothetical protein
MKTISRMSQLEDYGIIPLTGESDKHMYRILCDCTKRGKAIIERTLGLQVMLAENWNSGRTGDPHIGSLLLPLEFVPCLAVFALLSDTTTSEVWLLKNGTVIGFSVEDLDQKEAIRAHHEQEVRKIFYPMPCDRNLHHMSGRTV